MSQRKAWNEAMRDAAGGKIPIPGLNPIPRNRPSRSKRRDKARRATVRGGVGDDDGDGDGMASLVAYRLDALEEVDNDANEENGGGDEEFDELEDFDEDTGSGKKGRGRGRGKKAKPKAAAGRKRKATAAGAIPKKFKARSLASILMEESGRADSVVQRYLGAEARTVKRNSNSTKVRYPKRKFCPVAGLFGIYTDPKSGMPYANLQALEQIRERSPPWMSSLSGGSALYHDAVKSLRNE